MTWLPYLFAAALGSLVVAGLAALASLVVRDRADEAFLRALTFGHGVVGSVALVVSLALLPFYEGRIL